MCSRGTEEGIVYRKIVMCFLFVALSLSFLWGQDKEPVIYLEFSDFSGFLSDLQRNKSYQAFMGSSVLEWYGKSRLGLKFPKRIKEFEQVLGFALSLENINGFAGKETGIWLFDIGELEMLMITSIGEADYLRSRIAQSKEHFGEGRIDTLPFYFKKDEAGNREVDFAFVNGQLVISNEPAAFEQCVRRLSSGEGFLAWKRSDFLDWMEQPLDEAYDMLLYLSSESIRNTYFTSYWFHGNQEEIRSRFDRGIVLYSKHEKEIIEKRTYRFVEGFSFDTLAVEKLPALFRIIPEGADMVKIHPLCGEELSASLQKLMGGGKAMDSLIQSVEAMHPLAYGHFAVVRKGEVLPEIAEGFAVVVNEPDKEMLKQFNSIYPENLRKHELFSKNMPDMSMEGSMLFFASERGFFEQKKGIAAEGLLSYSFLDFDKFADAFSEEIELLSESERWGSYENRDFFKDNIGDLIRISSGYMSEIEIEGNIKEDLYIQKVIYTIQK